MDNQIYLVGSNISRVNLVKSSMSQFSPENFTHIQVEELLERDFRNNIIIIVEELGELVALKISDRFTDDDTNLIIDLHNNFTGLPVDNKVIFLPEITYDHAEKIAKKIWDELQVTSDINKFARFKDKQVKSRKFNKVRYEEVEQELEDLRNTKSEYEDTILELKQMLEDANAQLDEKIDELQAKNKEIKRLTDEDRSQISEHEKEVARLKRKISDLEIGEENYKKMLDEVSKKYDLVGFMSSYKFEDRKRRLIREAKEQGKKILGIVGNGKTFILNNIEENDSYVPIEDPDKADYWIIVTTPDKNSVELFKELIMSKPLNKSIKIMTLWNNGYPFTPESLVDSNLDLIIPYYEDAHKLEWLGEPSYSNWKLELNSLVNYALDR